jgi:glutathione peroxidase
MFSKIEVNGSARHPLYETLVGKDSPTKGNVKWNFTKILVGRDGKPIDRFGSLTSPSSSKLGKAIEKALGE